MPKPSARDRVLDAYESILIEHGPATVTLEAVAAEAGVSKGGLLYHFGSKDALLDGLLKRLRDLTDQDIAAAKEAREGVVRYYLRTSATDATLDNPLHRATLAVIRLIGHEPKVAETARACLRSWRDLLASVIDDPLTAELVAVIGDGIYLRGSLEERSTALVDDLDEVLKRIGA